MATTWLTLLWNALPLSSRWMVWNLFLALIPLVLSVWLFRRSRDRSPLWWIGCLGFIAFLPNAPYVLTDLIHLTPEIQQSDSVLVNTLITIPKFVLFELIGFGAYVLALINLGEYLKRNGLSRFVLPIELTLHGLCAIGIFLGRVERFNSWDLVYHPHLVLISLAKNLTDPRPLVFMTIGFGLLTALYWVAKQIVLALLLQRHYAKTLQQISGGMKQLP
jgi:uncharacterized membrane protein